MPLRRRIQREELRVGMRVAGEDPYDHIIGVISEIDNRDARVNLGNGRETWHIRMRNNGYWGCSGSEGYMTTDDLPCIENYKYILLYYQEGIRVEFFSELDEAKGKAVKLANDPKVDRTSISINDVRKKIGIRVNIEIDG